MSFTAGFSQNVTFKLDGQAFTPILNVTAHSWEEEVNRLLTTHSGTSGKATCIAGVLDAQGTVEGNVDAAVLWNGTPTASTNASPAGITAGAKGIITFAEGSTNPWKAHVMVTRVNWKSAVNGLVSISFNCALDDDASSFTRPS